MMKLSEIQGEDAIDVIADLIDPIAIMFADKKVEETIKSQVPIIVKAKVILKRQKKAILEVLAILNQTDPKDFKPSLIELPIMLVNLLQDIEDNPELKDLFSSQGQKITNVPFGSAMVTTQVTEEI